jgi:hypothetical protein
MCAGEGALAMPEQHGFGNLSGDGGAVVGHKWPTGPNAIPMQGSSYELFAGSALSCDQNGRATVREHSD